MPDIMKRAKGLFHIDAGQLDYMQLLTHLSLVWLFRQKY